jgi:peptidyl-prolyl cis-trans isomerase SurA
MLLGAATLRARHISVSAKGNFVPYPLLLVVLGIATIVSIPVAAMAQDAGTAKPGEPATIVASESSTGMAATVNGSVISNYDLDQRIALFVATSGVRPTKEDLPRLRAQVLRSLEDEALELQEAARRKIGVSPAEVEKALQNVASDNKITSEQLLATVGQAGVSAATFVGQLRAQIVWQKLVAARYGADIRITDSQTDEAMVRLRQGADKPQFLVSEVYLAVDKPEDETAIRASAEQIMQQTRQGAAFQTVAGQFSQSPSAANGGDIGWVLQGQLPEELDHALLNLQPGQIAGPIRAEGGYYIMLLRDRREPAGSAAAQPAVKPADQNESVPLDRFLIPLPPNADVALKDRAMKLASDVRSRSRGCSDLPAMARQLPGTVYQPLGNMNPGDLEPQLREALAGTGPGESVNPFASAAGIELIMRCDAPTRTPGVFQMPGREQVQQQLVMQQMSVYAKTYLAELRRNAVIYSGIR